MFFSTKTSPYLYLLSNFEAFGLFLGFNPLKISFTYILATLFGVPLRLSSVISIPNVYKISATFSSIISIFSASDNLNASSRIGVSALVDKWLSPIMSSIVLRFLSYFMLIAIECKISKRKGFIKNIYVLKIK